MHMPMPPLARLRELDGRAWAIATWAVPFMAQLVLATMFILLWLLGKVPAFMTPPSPTAPTASLHERAWFLSGALATTLVSMPVGWLLFRSGSSRVRGVALSIVGSTAVVLFGAVVFAFLAFRW